MTPATGLRAAAVLIAIGGVIDPVITLARRPTETVVVTTAVSATNRETAEQVTAAIESGLKERASVVLRPGAVPTDCSGDETCIAVVDGTRAPEAHRAPRAWHLVRLEADPGAINVGIVGVRRSTAVHPAAAGLLAVSLTAANVGTATTRLRAFDGDVLVGEHEYRWSGEPAANIALSWWPVADGARLLRIEAVTDGDGWAIDDAVRVGVEVTAEAAPVLVYETRPSWPATFVRRALEADPRLRVEARSRLGPSLSSSTFAARLDTQILDGFAVVIVGAPGDLSQAEADLLDRYVKTRGGTLVLLPDTAAPGASARWLTAGWRERVSATPVAMGDLRAGEYLQAERPGLLDRPLAAVDGRPTILLSPSGAGRVVVGGAMDAWRYRDDAGQSFSRFWQGLVADAAPLGRPLAITAASSLALRGQSIPVRVALRTMNALPSVTVRASMQCASEAPTPVRLWPAGPANTFEGTARAGLEGPCRFAAAVEGGPGGSVVLPVTDTGPEAPVASSLAAWTQAAVASGGMSVSAGGVADVVQALRESPSPSPVASRVAPMQSPWWLLPFAGCLGGEWWLRRRSGLR